MKRILGLDLGTNSIGGALIEIPDSINDFGKEGKIIWIGSRIIPIDGDHLQKFERGGQVVTKAAARRIKRGSRRLKQRYVSRRTRLIKVFKLLRWVNDTFPEDFKKELRNNSDFKFKLNSYLPFEDSTIEKATKLLGIKNNKNKLALSEDWIIYYLRKKALTEEITIQELARIIYMMNQRRGFKSGRKDLKNVDEQVEEKKWVEILTVESVKFKEDDEKKSKDGKITFEIKAGQYKWEVKRRAKPDWEGKQFTLLFTEKNGKLLTPKVPGDDDWELTMVALDNRIENSGKTVGEFFFDELFKDKNYKIRQQVVKRFRYENELKAIWEKQSEFHDELKDKSKLNEIAKLLYKNNSAKQKEIFDKDLLNVLLKDIIYYQRDLKSQKSSIGGCKYEKVRYKLNGEEKIAGVKVAPVTSPEFQEFRIWQDIHNIRIIQKVRETNGKEHINVEITKEYINETSKEKLFELFDSKDKVTKKDIFEILGNSDLKEETHSINLFNNREFLKGNETKKFFRKVFQNNNYSEGEYLLNNKDKFYKIWHILYSITSTDETKSKKGITTALSNSKNDFNLPPAIIEELSNQPEFKKDYKSYSSKAIKMLLPVMRSGNFWSEEHINEQTKKRINKIINGEFDEDIDNFTRDNIKKFFKQERGKKLNDLTINDFQGLPTWLSGYVVYGRHSERQSDKNYSSYKDINVMSLIPNNSLRNPIVESVVRETIHLVRDVWEKFGQPDEIHIELGRDLKKNAEERKKISEINDVNRIEKERLKKLLYELMNGTFEEYIDNGDKITSSFDVKPNPESPLDIEKFRIWKSCSDSDKPEYQEEYSLEKLFKDGKKEIIPSLSEIKKYILWLTQKCISPYTGKIIQLSKLFTSEYQIEHIIPRSRLKYDSMDNLVICESAINPEPYKGNKLARLFIREYSGKNLTINNIDYKILEEDIYVQHCKNIFKRAKLRNLLCEEIPDGFITRQLNDTRYISKKLNELLYPIAKNKQGLVFTIGSITAELKQNWQLNKVWKELLRQRFERLEKIADKKFIYSDENDSNNFHIYVDDPKFELKRIDHRHHALDALIIASTTREHIRYLSSLNAVDTNEELKNVKFKLVKGKIRDFTLPWNTFQKDVQEELSKIVVSFKANNKVISKPKNKYLKWIEKDGVWIKELCKQKSNNKWMSVRKSMFKENPQGIIFLKEIKNVSIIKAVEIELKRMELQDTPSQKTASYIYDKEQRQNIKELISRIGEDLERIKKHLKQNSFQDARGEKINKISIAEFVEYIAKRVTIDESFTEKKIDKIPYAKEGKSKIAGLLKKHLRDFNNKPNEAFKGEGLEKLFKKMELPIKKITTFEKKSDPIKFQGKIFEPDAGGIAYFVIYENENTKERDEMFSLSVHEVIQRKIQNKPVADKKEGYKTILLSPDELVYVPTLDELNNLNMIDWSNKKIISERTYKMVKSTGSNCYFIHNYISKLILPYDEYDDKKYGEFESQNCSEKTFDGKQVIKNFCIKIFVDRLGNIKPTQ